MLAAGLYLHLKEQFPGMLVLSEIQDGLALYWEVKRVNPSTRLVRVSENVDGHIREIKLAQSSLGAQDVLLPLPATNEAVADAVRAELRMLQDRQASDDKAR